MNQTSELKTLIRTLFYECLRGGELDQVNSNESGEWFWQNLYD